MPTVIKPCVDDRTIAEALAIGREDVAGKARLFAETGSELTFAQYAKYLSAAMIEKNWPLEMMQVRLMTLAEGYALREAVALAKRKEKGDD